MVVRGKDGQAGEDVKDTKRRKSPGFIKKKKKKRNGAKKVVQK